MSVEEQIRRARARRDRLSWLGLAADLVFVLLFALMAADRLGRHPLLSLVPLAYAFAMAVRPLVVEGMDALQRQLGLRNFALAASAGVAYLVADVVAHAARWPYPSRPGVALQVIGLTWMLANLATQWRWLMPWEHSEQ